MRVRRASRARGFTLIEVVVVLAILGITAVVAIPALQRLIHRTRVMGELGRVTSMIQLARLEAVRRGVPTVIGLDADTGELVAFADVDGADPGTGPDGLFNPQDPAPERGTDFEIRRMRLAGGLSLEEPGGQTGQNAFTGLDNPAGFADGVLIFLPNGAVAATGAFRFGDGRDNYIEVNISPAASGRARLRKYNDGWDANPVDDTHWYGQGEVERVWEWE